MVLTSMTPENLIASLGERAITLKAVGGQLKATPARLLTDDDRALIKEHRPELLALLTAPAEAPRVVKRATRKAAPVVVPTVTEPLPTGVHGECPQCRGRMWRLQTTPASNGRWLWTCASCADRVARARQEDDE